MDDQGGAPPQSRKPRADAARNRDRVLAAAQKVFNAGGSAASLEGVAREAGVGIGTLYRHFPTREALFEAVYRREVQHLEELAERLLAEADPVNALRRWMHGNVEFVATKRGMSEALAMAAGQAPPDLVASTFARLCAAVGSLLDRARTAGAIRGDVGPDDLVRGLVGLCYIQDQPGWQYNVVRLVDLLVDGLTVRPRAR